MISSLPFQIPLTFVGVLAVATTAGAQGYDSVSCPSCAQWNEAHAPVKLYGNTYFVGTNGLSAILIASPRGHVLIDGGLPESAPRIRANIEQLGFHLRDVKLILNSHDHYDHAGGIAQLARESGAQVAATRSSAATLRNGKSLPSDPQFGVALPFPKVARVRVIADGDTLRVGPIAMVAHVTAGHTVGGTTWTWRSCEGNACLDMVYADSQTPISDDTFRYTGDSRYATAAADLAHGRSVLESLRCDVLITPHPSASQLWERVSTSLTGGAPALVDANGCKRYAATARAALEKRLATERASK